MKSAGERAIANWLIKAGVDFEYERPYEVNVADAQHSQYRPDFFYPSTGVYHEHWALVPGQVEPPGYEGYLESSAWKKRVHSANGTTLIETAARDLGNGSLFAQLERQLRASGIEPDFDPDRPVPGSPLLTDREMLNLFRTFLAHAKSNRLEPADLRSRVAKARNGTPDLRESLFLDLFDDVREEWDSRLREANEVDFEDMLNQATDLVEAGRWVSPFRVVLVDEFQDASHARARLVKALVNRPAHFLFAVGDDWQSIYRFAGSDISAMTQFEETFGAGHVMRLERTFRSSQELSTLAGDFVMKNPNQLTKKVRSDRSHPAPVELALVDTEAGVTDAIAQRLSELSAAVPEGSSASVKILGRYRYEEELVPRTRYRGLDVTFQTVHSSKGLEADHVIIPGLNRGGFPSTKEDDPLLRLALPEGDDYPHAEERRLFYVALTRARDSVLLIARSGRESEFVTELLSDGVISLLGDHETGDGCPRAVPVMRPRAHGCAAGEVRTVPGMQPLPGLHVEATNHQLTDAGPSMDQTYRREPMSKREERERQRMMAMLPDEGEVAGEIFAAMATVGEPGAAITPDLAALASQVAGAEAAGRWLKAGHSLDDCGMVRGSTSTSVTTSERTLHLGDGSTAQRFRMAMTDC